MMAITFTLDSEGTWLNKATSWSDNFSAKRHFWSPFIGFDQVAEGSDGDGVIAKIWCRRWCVNSVPLFCCSSVIPEDPAPCARNRK